MNKLIKKTKENDIESMNISQIYQKIHGQLIFYKDFKVK
jgi:hypothetical protein